MKMRTGITTIGFILLIFTAIAWGQSFELQRDAMIAASDEVATYTYSRLAHSTIVYSNDTTSTEFMAEKATLGGVNLTARAGWWRHSLTDATEGINLSWEGYLLNGTEYWKEDGNWTQFNLTDVQAVLDDYDELPSQMELLNYSNLSESGSELIDGEECIKFEGEPDPFIKRATLANQLFASYLSSPFPLPDEFDRESFDLDGTSILNSSEVTVAAWISKNSSLLRRIEVNSSLTLTPEILNITEPDFKIQSTLHERTDYSGYGEPVTVALPAEGIVTSYRMTGADWIWAAFGLVEP